MKNILKKISAIAMAFTLLGTGTALIKSNPDTMTAFATQTRSWNYSSNYSLTGNGATDIVRVADAQIGKTKSGLGYTEDWCADFVSDCAKLAGQSDAVPADGLVTTFLYGILDKGGAIVSSPRAGDLVFYEKNNDYWHVGIMIDSSASIQGNCKGQVKLLSRPEDAHIGTPFFVRPNYSNADSTPAFSSIYEELMFDADFYYHKYKDLQKSIGNDPDKLLQHWFKYGIKEGRVASIFFDPQYYAAQNPDVKKVFGNNWQAIHDHFLQCGYKDNRKLSPVFDVSFYGSKYSDLRSMSSAQRIEHFYKYGCNEGRKACADFNPENYKNRYSDLNKAYGNSMKSYYQHYMIYGINEGRFSDYSSIYEEIMFDAYFYYSKYKDVRDAFGYDPDKLRRHWLKNGINEGRTASIFFDPQYYAAQNPDVKKVFGSNWKAIHDHFLTHGYKENRKLSPVFDVGYYRTNYSDLRSMNSEQLIEHFYQYGCKDGRKASADFNPVNYRSRYSDLNKAYGSNMKSYYQHYMLNGIKEKRNGK